TVEHVPVTPPGGLGKQEEQQAGQIHRRHLDGGVLVLRVGRGIVADLLVDLVADHRGEQVGHQARSEEHTSELQSRFDLVCRLLLEIKKKYNLFKIVV